MDITPMLRKTKEREIQRETNKRALFLHYTKSSQLLSAALTDLCTIKAPWCTKFTKSNAIHPFADSSSLEFFSHKTNCSQLLFASHSKKRPSNVTWIRCFAYQIFDMIETTIDIGSFRSMAHFKGRKPPSNVRPTLSFSGSAWHEPSQTDLTLFRSMLVDFFRGPSSDAVSPKDLQMHISFTVDHGRSLEERPQIKMRCWKICSTSKKHNLPSISLQEVGPRIDFSVGRTQHAPESLLKQAVKMRKVHKVSTSKNIQTNDLGNKLGKVHLAKQDLSGLQARKSKALKRSRDGFADSDQVTTAIANKKRRQIQE